MSFSDESKIELAKPLNPKHVKPPPKGKFGEYVEAWHVIAEANRIFGFDGWSRETVSMLETNREIVTLQGRDGPYDQWRVGFVAKVRISAGGIMREGTGFGSGMSKPEAVGEAIESAVKEAETDAMKRGLMTFGHPFGLALYDKSKSNVGDDAPAHAPKRPTESPPPPKPNHSFDTYSKTLEACITLDDLQGAFKQLWRDPELTDPERTLLKSQYDTRKKNLPATITYTPPDFSSLDKDGTIPYPDRDELQEALNNGGDK